MLYQLWIDGWRKLEMKVLPIKSLVTFFITFYHIYLVISMAQGEIIQAST